LQSAAPVNGVLVGETTYRATRHVIDYAEREPVSAKGKAELIPVWEAVQARSRLGVDLAAPAPPLVGRNRQLDLLVHASELARHADWVEERLLALVGGGGETDLTAARRDDSFAAWRRFFEAMAERRPLVLVFEDLHWADEGLLDFVDHLVDWAGAVPLLVLGT